MQQLNFSTLSFSFQNSENKSLSLMKSGKNLSLTKEWLLQRSSVLLEEKKISKIIN
jgi:hypothetical protein